MLSVTQVATKKSKKAASAVILMIVDAQLIKRVVKGYYDSSYPSNSTHKDNKTGSHRIELFKKECDKDASTFDGFWCGCRKGRAYFC